MRVTTAEFTKVPEITLGFWIIKIFATTLGETGGDSHHDAQLGLSRRHRPLPSSLLITGHRASPAKRFHPVSLLGTIVASTTFGTTMADFADRSLGIGYTGGTALAAHLPRCGARPLSAGPREPSR
jgi:uncharacterized membrane-anchored protein